MNIALVYHPGMAPRRLARVAALARVLGERGHHATHHDSMTFDAARDAPAAEALCICGGDGTAQLVISRQPDIAALPPVAIYPTGTINLLARELDYPRDPLQFTRRLEAGRAALAAQLEKGVPTAFITVEVHDVVDADPLGNEPLFDGQGAMVGRATSGYYGHVLKKSLAIGYVKSPFAAVGTRLQIEILGEKKAATVLVDSPYDPENSDLKA